VILGGHWKSLPAKVFLDAFSANVPFMMRAIPIVLLPAVLGLGGSIWIAWSDRTTRLMWWRPQQLRLWKFDRAIGPICK